MNVSPAGSPAAQDRRVHFCEVVNVRQYLPADEVIPVDATDVLRAEAARVEFAVRATPSGPAVRITQPDQIRLPVQPRARWKNVCYMAALMCGTLFLPSFLMLMIGPIGLVAPAALLVSALALWAVAGKPTGEMREYLYQISANNRRHDSQ